MKKTIYKSVIQIEVLTDEPLDENTNLSDILHDAEFGDISMIRVNKRQNKPLKGVKAVREIKSQGSAPEFFMMDENGNELED